MKRQNKFKEKDSFINQNTKNGRDKNQGTIIPSGFAKLFCDKFPTNKLISPYPSFL